MFFFYFPEKVDASEVPLTDVLYTHPVEAQDALGTFSASCIKHCVVEDGEYNFLHSDFFPS